jgi:sugar lactone lactonase YvrE
MKLFFVLTVLLSFLGRGFSDETVPMVSTLYSGEVSPVGIWADASGNIYGCETGFHTVFKLTSGGVKTDFAGTRGTAGVASEGVLAVNALFNSPRAVWGDGQFLYVTDSVNNRIRRVSWTTSLVTTVVGGGTGSIFTSGSFPGTSVALSLPNAIAGSSNGKVYFADFDHVYMLAPETGLVGVVSFIAGGGDRIGTFAHGAQVSLKDIQGLAVDPTNNNFLFVADSGNKVVRKMDLSTGKSIIFAGRVKKEKFHLPSKPFKNGETAYKVKLGNPSSVWVDSDGSVFIADSFYHTISVVRHDKIYLFAGKWQSSISNTLMTGPASQVQIEASHVFGDSSRGVLYLCDGTRGGIQQISPLTVNVYVKPTAAPTKNPTEAPARPPTVSPTINAIVHYDSTYKIGVESSELTDNDKKTICQTILETTVPKPDFCEIVAVGFTPNVTNRRRLKLAKPLDITTYTADVTARLQYNIDDYPDTTVEELTETVTAALEKALEDKSFGNALTVNAETNEAVHLQGATVEEVHTVVSIVTSQPTSRPTRQPSGQPTSRPSTSKPSGQPTSQPTVISDQLISTTNFDSLLLGPADVWADGNGNVFVATYFATHNVNHYIYKQSSDGSVSRFAGIYSEGNFSGDGGLATQAALFSPKGLWGDSDYLYFCDFDNGRIRAIDFVSNIITTIIGGGNSWTIGPVPQPATAVSVQAQSIWGDGQDNLYILTDRQVLLYSIADKTIKLLAYSPSGASMSGLNGEKVPLLDLRPDLELQSMSGDATRNCLYIVEMGPGDVYRNVIVRKLDLTSKTATIFAGNLAYISTDQYTDGIMATSMAFSGTYAGLWVATDGTVFVSDSGSNVISAVNPNTGRIRWFAGTWNDYGDSVGRADVDGNNELLNMDGPAKLGKMYPKVIAGNSQLDTLYVVDDRHNAVRQISSLFTSPAVALPGHRKLDDEEEVISSSSSRTPVRLSQEKFHLRGVV